MLPMMPGMPERRTHDYLRHGVTSLFAAFNIADDTVIGELHRRHRAVEFKKFLVRIDKAVGEGVGGGHQGLDRLVKREPQTLHLSRNRRRGTQLASRLPRQGHSSSQR